MLLQEVSKVMTSGRELCKAAFAQKGNALEFVSEEMKGDLELCMAAVAQNGAAIRYFAFKLQCDEEMNTVAMKSNPGYISKYWMRPIGPTNCKLWCGRPSKQ